MYNNNKFSAIFAFKRAVSKSNDGQDDLKNKRDDVIKMEIISKRHKVLINGIEC